MPRLSHREIRHLSAFIEVLTSPLAFPDSGSWRRAANAKALQLLNAERAAFMLAWEDDNPIEQEGQDPAAPTAWVEYYHQFDHQIHLERRQRGWTVVAIHEQLERDWGIHPELRHDFLERFRLDSGVSIAHDFAPNLVGWCNFYPGNEKPERFEERTAPILEVALPAFRAGLETLYRTRGLRVDFSRLLDQVSDGFLLVDRRGHIVYQNHALQRILAADPQAQLIRAALEMIVRRVRIKPALEEVVTLLGATDVVTPRATYEVIPTVPGPDLRQLGVELLIQVVQRTALPPSCDLLHERFGLTARETDVARCLVHGLSYKAVAQKLGLSIDTVRSHIRSIYAKLDVRSVAGAVSRVLAD